MHRTQKTGIAFVMLIGFMLLVGLPAQAQDDFPRSEIFGGYTYTSVDTTINQENRRNANGWALSVNGNVNKFFGITFDMTGSYWSFAPRDFPSAKADYRAFEFLFGPTLSARTRLVTGFGHFLLGPARLSIDNGRTSISNTKFSMGIGGGVDFNVNKNFAIRGIEVDYLPVHLGKSASRGEITGIDSAWSNNIRLKAGVVIKF